MLAVALAAWPARAETSKLWGIDGDAWDPRGRLPDFSHAGYRGGGVPLPDVPIVANVKDFGATGDGVTDDTAAILAAIDATTDGAILIPRGRYVVTDVLRIAKSRIVLRGEGSGSDGTVLFITKSLSDVLGPNTEWSWNGGFIWADPSAVGAPLTQVSAAASRGDASLRVADTDGIEPGALVSLRLLDDADGSLGSYLHAGESMAGDCEYMVPLVLDWPVRVKAVEAGEIVLAQPLRTDVRPGWTPEIHTLPALEEVGVEHLRIEFIETPYAGHLVEPGYNAIAYNNGVANSWVQDVTIVNADGGIFTERQIKNVTLRGIELAGRGGHHAISVSLSSDVLVEDFFVGGSWVHALTVTHRSSGTVFSRGSGEEPLELDHHGDIPFESLFTELGEYNFESSGNACAMPHSGARNTYWNLAAPMTVPIVWASMQTNVVGETTLGDVMTEAHTWVENVPALEPANLYEAQLGQRVCGELFDACNQGRFDAEAGACLPAKRVDGTACDDGDATTAGDACAAGVCAGARTEAAGCDVAAAGGRAPSWLLSILGLAAGALGGRYRPRRNAPPRST